MSTIRIAAFELLRCDCEPTDDQQVRCALSVRDHSGVDHDFSGRAERMPQAVASAIAGLCTHEFEVRETQVQQTAPHAFQVQAVVQGPKSSGAGIATADDEHFALAIAILKAVNHAGLLNRKFRANNQKVLRQWAADMVRQWQLLLDQRERPDDPQDERGAESRRLMAESIALEHFNRVASAAVVTATNHPRQESVLGLYDTSAWLYDDNGKRRQECTDTNVWLAWYPRATDDERTVQQVMDTMPAAPKSAIPWVVRMFENPKSWLRFRGAVALDDHDVLHVLLGRGLQDQDEAFVLGFAMGTAKRGRGLQHWIFRWILSRLYPEPYRIPKYLLPAFELGVNCGNATGLRNLYHENLQTLLHLPVTEARRRMQIDMSLVRDYFERERQAIPTTIASLRLP